MQQSCSVDEIRQKISKNAKQTIQKFGYSSRYFNICKRMLKGDIPIIILENKIKRAQENIRRILTKSYGGFQADIKVTW